MLFVAGWDGEAGFTLKKFYFVFFDKSVLFVDKSFLLTKVFFVDKSFFVVKSGPGGVTGTGTDS